MADRYIALTQSPYCCVPTALLMILIRRNLPLLQVADIAYELGLSVPEDMRNLYPRARVGVRPSSGFGTEIQNPKYSLNSFFERHNYPIRETYYSSAPSLDTAWLQNLLKVNADILVCFNNTELFGGESDWGHVCIVESVSGDSVTLIDTEARQPKFRTVQFGSLCSAIGKHGEANRGGFWVVNSVL